MPLRWDRETLYNIHFVSHPPDRTLFAGIYQLPPASYLIADGTHVRIVPYWDWNYPTAGEPDRDDDVTADSEWVERLQASLVEAVRLRLRADVPVACYLSGGIDSCAVLGFASQMSPRPLRAYTLSFDHADYDEGEFARQQARRSGAEFCQIDVRSDHLADHFGDAIYHAERPFANGHAIAKYLLSAPSRLRRSSWRQLRELSPLSHFRRDLVLYGSNHRDPAARARLLAQLDASNKVSAGTLMPQGSTTLDAVGRVLGFVPSNLEAWAQIGNGLLRVTSDGFRNRFAARDTFRVLLSCLDVERQLAGRHPVNQSLYIWGKTMLPNYILSNLGDRMEMAHSVEGRLPFLDHHVVEEAARMPVAMKIRGMTEKYVLRQAARHVLIDAVYSAPEAPVHVATGDDSTRRATLRVPAGHAS